MSEAVKFLFSFVCAARPYKDFVGGRFVVPASFTHGSRYYMMNYQHAMAIRRVYGPPEFFVTFTCNTEWREIADALRYESGQLPCDWSDLVARVFHMKVHEFIADVKEGRTFDVVRAVSYTVEFQKHGLPHAHCLVWLSDARSKFSASIIEQAGDDSDSGNDRTGAPDQARSRPSPEKRISKKLFTDEEASAGDDDDATGSGVGAADHTSPSKEA